MTALPRDAGPVLIRLRRDGMPPLRFRGRRIAFHDAPPPDATLWHDLSLYRRSDGGYAVAIVARTQSGPARCHAAATDTLDAALTLLERHDAAQDLCPGLTTAAVAFDDPALPPILLALQASQLQCIRHDVQRRYRDGVGAFLMALGRIELMRLERGIAVPGLAADTS